MGQIADNQLSETIYLAYLLLFSLSGMEWPHF